LLQPLSDALGEIGAPIDFFARFWIAVWLINVGGNFNDRELPGAIFALNGSRRFLAGFRHSQPHNAGKRREINRRRLRLLMKFEMQWQWHCGKTAESVHRA